MKMPSVYKSLFIAGTLGSGILAQFPPAPKGVTVVHSKNNPDISVSYKRVNSVCETTPGVNSYSGFVHLPASLLAKAGLETPGHPYNLSTYFMYVETRHGDPADAPLAIWLSGGPGESGLVGMIGQNGPCTINADDSSTTLNPWSFNSHVNMLYIDQPNQCGFSYDKLTNGTIDLTTTEVSTSVGSSNQSSRIGTFSSQDPTAIATTTQVSAEILWHVMQAWTQVFPVYKPKNESISIWGNSYAGFFNTATMSYFEQQNQKIKAGELDGCGARYFNLNTLGVTNGCMDGLIQFPYWPIYAYNNTYGRQLIPKSTYEKLLKEFSMPGGCKDLVQRCRELGAQGDPLERGNNATVNAYCVKVLNKCFEITFIPESVNISSFDISHRLPEPFINEGPVNAYFNQRWVQEALGVPLNFTSDTLLAGGFLFGTADILRRNISSLSTVLQSDIKVAMVYGDRDSRCNWLGAEQLALAADYGASKNFHAAGFQPLITNSTYTGGVVKQYGGFSFSRVFEAGHGAGFYQPETVYKIFMRAMFDKDIATGKKQVQFGSSYSSSGPASAFGIKNKMPPPPPLKCNVWGASTTCSKNQIEALLEDNALITDDIVIEPRGHYYPYGGLGRI